MTTPVPTMTEPDRAALARRIVRFCEVLDDRVATTVQRVPCGVARLSPELRLVYSLNHVEVQRPVAPSELAQVMDRVLGGAGLDHRMVLTTVPEVAWTLAPSLVGDRWSASTHVYMVHDGTTRPPVSALGVQRVDLPTWADAARAFVADEEWGRPPEVQDHMGGRDRRFAERVDARFLLADDGTAGCHVYLHGGIAQIENVHVLTEARGRGLGHALMAAALAECADAGTVFLIADAEDWPRRWYGRLGFVPVTSGWEWVRPPAS